MPRTDSFDRGGCSLCNRAPSDSPLLECLACLREGNDNKDQAFCGGGCFRRHWRLHRDQSLGTSRQEYANAKIAATYSVPTLRATSQPFTPSSETKSQQQPRARPSPRVLQYPSLPGSGLPYLGGQTAAHPILATGPAYLRR